MTRTRWITTALFAAGLFPAHAAPQEGARLALTPPQSAGSVRPASASGVKRIEALSAAAAAPRVDGRLDDAAWRGARWVSDFVQREPEQGAAPTQRTEVAFLFDGEALLVGARMQSDARGRAPLTRRDDAGSTERLVVSLDTYHDRRTAYTFAVTAAGVRLDWYHPQDNPHLRDDTFNPVWEARVARDSAGWTAEMRIPFSQLRFNAGAGRVWGVNVVRVVPARNEEDAWVLIPRDTAGWASRFGELVGLDRIPAARRVEVLPYVSGEARLADTGTLAAGDPFRDGRDRASRAGGDLKVGLGPSLTLDATVNPDFGQVDADPAEVNLTAFETYLEERRPFFTEGRQTLTGAGPDYFYSRRIGAAPRGRATGDFTRVPRQTTILGAAKVTGRLASGLSVGALGALTGAERAETFDSETGAFGRPGVAPLTGYGVLRLQQEVGRDASTVGATLTGVERDVGASVDDPLGALLPRRALAGGVDWVRRFQGGAYEMVGHLGMSRVEGDTAAIWRLQRSSARYFQRPDQEHVELDPARTSLSGWSAALRGMKRSGRWQWHLGAMAESPGFEINDLGQLGDVDNVSTWAGLAYRQSQPGPVLRNWMVRGFSHNRWNFGGVRTTSFLGLFGAATWKNFWQTWAQGGMELPSLSDGLTRGGPLMRSPLGWWGEAGIEGSPAKRTRWGVELTAGGNELGGWRYQAEGEVSTQLGDRVTLAVEPRYSRREDARQFLASREGGGSGTFGKRYVFGRIGMAEIAAPVRLGWSLTPDLSVDLYAEPFAASGRYSDIGELAAARTSDLRPYGAKLTRDGEGNYMVRDGGEIFTLPNPDFAQLSFRSNAVVRWEWNPGSTLFVVWQQNRSDTGAAGSTMGAGDLFRALGAAGENVLALKLSYWLPL